MSLDPFTHCPVRATSAHRASCAITIRIGRLLLVYKARPIRLDAKCGICAKHALTSLGKRKSKLAVAHAIGANGMSTICAPHGTGKRV